MLKQQRRRTKSQTIPLPNQQLHPQRIPSRKSVKTARRRSIFSAQSTNTRPKRTFSITTAPVSQSPIHKLFLCPTPSIPTIELTLSPNFFFQQGQVKTLQLFPFENGKEYPPTHSSITNPFDSNPRHFSTFPTPEDFEKYLSTLKVSVKRLDQVHDEVSGNKFFKLRYNLLPHITEPTSSSTSTVSPDLPTIVTFGGAFSNHIAATAAVAELSGLRSVGVIRGEELSKLQKDLNPTLSTSLQNKMNLVYMDRHTYRHRNHPKFNAVLIDQLKKGKQFYVLDKNNQPQPIHAATDSRIVFPIIPLDFNDNSHLVQSGLGPGPGPRIYTPDEIKAIAKGQLKLDPNQDDFIIPLYLRPEARNQPQSTSIDLSNGNLLLIPEGGTNQAALVGTSEIVTEKDFSSYSHITTAVGTGGTIGGLALKRVKLESESKEGDLAQVLGFAAVYPLEIDLDLVDSLLDKMVPNPNANQINPSYKVIPHYLGKGYGQVSDQLLSFISQFELVHSIPLDQVYTGKMVYGVFDMIYHGLFPPGSNILILHTGGLQGRSM